MYSLATFSVPLPDSFSSAWTIAWVSSLQSPYPISFNKNVAFWSLCWLPRDIQEAFHPPCSECSISISRCSAGQISSNNTQHPKRWPPEHQSCVGWRILQSPECELFFILWCGYTSFRNRLMLQEWHQDCNIVHVAQFLSFKASIAYHLGGRAHINILLEVVTINVSNFRSVRFHEILYSILLLTCQWHASSDSHHTHLEVWINNKGRPLAKMVLRFWVVFNQQIEDVSYLHKGKIPSRCSSTVMASKFFNDLKLKTQLQLMLATIEAVPQEHWAVAVF